jgi:hypothetical protein
LIAAGKWVIPNFKTNFLNDYLDLKTSFLQDLNEKKNEYNLILEKQDMGLLT